MDEMPDTSMFGINDDGVYECCICGETPAELDFFGYPWCNAQLCMSRRDFLAWGRVNEYPYLRSANEDGNYACGDGIYNWVITALMGDAKYITSMINAIVRFIESEAA